MIIGMKTEKKSNIIAYILLAVSLVIFYLANHYAVFEMDDLWYSTNLVTGEPLNSINDIWQSQVWHFLNWGGRSIAHGQLQIILMCGETAANILNMLALIVLVFLINKHAANQPINVFLILATIGALVIFNANWYQTLFWESGASNYLYMTMWMLLFLYPYMMTLNDANNAARNRILKAVLLIPLGLISGWSNENMGTTVFLITLVTVIITYKEQKKIYVWQLTGSISALIGSALCILAPGNFVRVNDAANADADKGLLWRVFLRCYSTANGLLFYLIVPLVVFAILCFVYVEVMERQLRKQDVIFVAAGVVSWGAMILSPHYPDRAAFGSMVFFLIPIIKMLGDILKEGKKQTFSNVVCVIIWLGGIYLPIVYICQQIGWINK